MPLKESKLDEIYGLVEYSKKTGIELTEGQLRQISGREEQYIMEEVMPLIKSSIEPVLGKIRREITLVVNYRPDEPITLRISRDSGLSDLNPTPTDLERSDALAPDTVPEFHKRSTQQRNGNRRPKKSLIVTMEDGTVIYNSIATDTFCEVIRRIGLMRVRNLSIKASGINIVSTSIDPNRMQRRVGEFYILTNLSTSQKAGILKEIAEGLGLAIKVEVKE